MNRNSRIATFAVTGALVFATGAWGYSVIRRAVLDRVTLRVNQAPLAKVIAAIAAQTREQIVVDGRLTMPVTLDARDQPLDEVLDRLAEQADAFWRTTFAVHRSSTATDSLARSLVRGGTADATIWTNLSAQPPRPAQIASEPPPRPPGSPPDGHGFVVMDVEDFHGPPPGPVGGKETLPLGPSDTFDQRIEPDGSAGPMLVKKSAPTPGGHRRVVIRAGTPDGEGGIREFDLSPSRILMEIPLIAKVSQPIGFVSSREDAERLAQSTHARVTRIISVEPSPVPHLPPEVRTTFRRRSRGGTPDGPPMGPPSIAELGARAEKDIRKARYDNLTRLTPEQRARQASRLPDKNEERSE